MELRTASESDRYLRVGEFVARRVAGDVILVPIRGRAADLSDIFQLNGVAAFVWEALESPASVDEIVRGVTDAFEVAAERAREDVVELLAVLDEAGLVSIERKPA